MRPFARGREMAPGIEVIEHLHRSNVFDVYDAWDHGRRCRCIAKTPRPDQLLRPAPRERLAREAELLGRLVHPNLVRGYGYVDGDRPVSLTETLTGATLAHLIDASPRRLSAAGLAYLGLHLCGGVGYLHAQGVLHCDLKPANLVAEHGRPVIIDLSLAHPLDGGPARPGHGTWCYLAPEQARGGRLTPAVDVWGLGAVLWEAAAGEAAFGEGDEDTFSIPYPQLERRAEPIARRRRLPRALAGAIDACLEAEPERRPGLDELVAALERVPGVAGLRAPRPR